MKGIHAHDTKMKCTPGKNTLLAATANNDMLTVASGGSASGRESSLFQSEIPAKTMVRRRFASI